MSTYNLAFGDRSAAYGAIPALLGANLDVGRYRDTWMEQDGPDSVILAVYTRNGGGNRESYAEQINNMQDHEFYLDDRVDSFDSTYATFRFRIPKTQLINVLGSETADHVLQNVKPARDTDQRWADAIDAIRNGTPA